MTERRVFRLAGWAAVSLSAACSGGGSGATVGDGGAARPATPGSEGAASAADGSPSSTDGNSASTDADSVSMSPGGPDSGSLPPPGDDGGAPAGFWTTASIPVAKNVMTFVFLNRTNGKYKDGEVYWRFKGGAINELHAIAAQSTYDMPANSSGRMYFYLCAAGDASCVGDPAKSPYYDFIEFTIGAAQFNGNTTRVDAFGIKIAMRLHCADGYDVAVGENYATFAEDRAATFQGFINAVPAEFQGLAQPPHAPYRIVQPGAGGFDMGGPQAAYYNSFVDSLWSANGLTIAKPGPDGSGLAAYPNLSAAIFRHVGATAGTFSPTGTLLDKQLWADRATFYAAAPADYYAKFWHDRALGGKAYGFPYDDVGGYSSYVSHANPQYLLVALGW